MPISFDSAIGIHEQALLLREKRSEVLAENLANVDTPNYKARDIDFNSILRQETATGGADPGAGAMRLVTTDHSHLQPNGGLDSPPLLYRVPTQPSADGNTVENQVEQAKFSENAVRYEASYTFLNGSIKGLLTAIKGQ